MTDMIFIKFQRNVRLMNIVKLLKKGASERTERKPYYICHAEEMMRCSEENTGASFEHYSIYKF